MRAVLAGIFLVLVLALAGATSLPSAGADPQTSAPTASASAVTVPSVICTPAWGTPVVCI